MNSAPNPNRCNRLVRAVRAACALTACAAGIAPAAFAAAVTSCADDGPGSLRATVAAALSGDTIDLSHLTCPAGKLYLLSGDIQTSKTLTFAGPGAAQLTISAGTLSRVVSHTGAQLTISNLTLSGGRTSGFGGCIYSTGSVSLQASVVTNCGGNGSLMAGGALAVKGNLQMIGSSVSASFLYGTQNYGGGIYAQGDLVMRTSTISGNHAVAHRTGVHSFGGGAFVKGNVDLRDSAIVANVAGYYLPGNSYYMTPGVYYGGNVAGLLVSASSGKTVQMVNSTISSNSSASHIGGLYSNVPVTLSNSTIASNGQVNADYTNFAAGVSLYNTTGNFANSIVFGNVSYGQGTFYNFVCCYESDVGGLASTVSGSTNVIGNSYLYLPGGTITADPQLGPLQNNGGPTLTHALGPNSSAIGAGANPLGLTFDQRGPGFARKFAGKTDIGAFQSGDSIFNSGLDPPS